MTRRIAVKRLSAVEVDPDVSHQHEFHADALRTQLGFPPGKTSGSLRLALYLTDDPADVVANEGRYTLYDAREAHPTRSEYRLYYDSAAVADALPGDLLVVFAEDEGSLGGLVVRAGTRMEADLLAQLGDSGQADLGRFGFLAAPTIRRGSVPGLAQALVMEPATPPSYIALAADEIARADDAGTIPGTVAMALLGQRMASRAHGTLGPDETLYHGMEAESDIYFEMEHRIQSANLMRMQEGGADLTDVTSFVLSMLQSRKSRRGQSLQNHFAALLDREKILYTAQCRTEPGETPDFIVPSCPAYHDPDYPAANLRLVACKTTSRERWRQILSEGDRVQNKYLLTVDPGLTPETVAAMAKANLSAFLPAPILAATYAGWAGLRTVSELVEDLRTIG